MRYRDIQIQTCHNADGSQNISVYDDDDMTLIGDVHVPALDAEDDYEDTEDYYEDVEDDSDSPPSSGGCGQEGMQVSNPGLYNDMYLS